MIYSLFTLIELVSWIQVVLLFVAAYLGGRVVTVLYRKKPKNELMKVKRFVLLLLTIGVAALAFAYSIQNVLGDKIITFADFFFIIGFSMLALGFNHFWYGTAKMHKLHVKEPVFIFGVICGVFIWLYYLFVEVLIPATVWQILPVQLINFYYPVIVSLTFIFTLVVHPRMKAGLIRTPIWYLSNGVFIYFIGYMLYFYTLWNTTEYFIQYIYTFMFLISAFYYALGFYAAKKKYV